jgi:heme-degrading monooxygenase HmoA
MYAAIRRYNIAPGSADSIVQRVNERLLPVLNQMPGFIAYYLINPGDGTVVSVSVFEDRAGADASTRTATEWVRQHLGAVVRTAPVIVTGVVATQAGSPTATS